MKRKVLFGQFSEEKIKTETSNNDNNRNYLTQNTINEDLYSKINNLTIEINNLKETVNSLKEENSKLKSLVEKN